MTIPEGFELEPVKAGSHPAPDVPTQQKTDIYDDAESYFKTIDEHAIEEAKISYGSFRELMWNLVFRAELDELQKARTIFRWLTAKNIHALEFDTDQPTPPEKLLAAFKSGNGSYARAFEYMARYAGLHCVSVTGWAKGASYKPGEHVTSEPANHSWNAVYIDGNWFLLDCHWATRHDESVDVKYDYDDFYFLTDPAEMIYSHFPENTGWQLLQSPWTGDEFEERAYVKSQFFLHKLQLDASNTCVIGTDSGLATLSLSFSYPVAFTYRLKPQDNNIESKGLSRYVLQEMTDHHLMYFIRPPASGSYLLTIFARDFLDGVSPKTMITFRSVAEYKVVCDSASDEVILPFPYCSDSSWGLDMYASFIGSRLIPNHRTAVVFCPTGHGSISLKLADPELRIYARLVRDGLSFDALKRGVTVAKEDKQVVIEVELPEPGEYGLEVFVNDPDKDGKLFAHFCQYLFTTDTGGSFASTYKAAEALHEVAAESADAEEITTTGSHADIEEHVEGDEAATYAKPNAETIVISEQADQQLSEEQRADEADVGKMENDQQNVEEEQELAEEVLTQQTHAANVESSVPTDQEIVEKPDKDQESSEKVEDEERTAAEEETEPEIAEELVVATEQSKAETVPAGEPDDLVVAEEPVKDQAGGEEEKHEKVEDEEHTAAEEEHTAAEEETEPEIAKELVVETEQSEAETVPADEPADHVVAEELVNDQAGAEEEKTDDEGTPAKSAEVVTEIENDQQNVEEEQEAAEEVLTQQTRAENLESSVPTDQEIAEILDKDQESLTLVESQKAEAETISTSEPEDQVVAEEQKKDEADVEEVRNDEEDLELTSEVAAEVADETEQAVETSKPDDQSTSEQQESLEQTENVEEADSDEVTETVKSSVAVAEPTEGQDSLEKVESSEQEATELSAETQETEAVETDATADQEAPEDTKTEQSAITEVASDLQPASTESAKVDLTVVSVKAETVEITAPADQHVPEESKDDQEGSNEQTVEEAKEDQPYVEDMKNNIETTLAESTEAVTELRVETEQAETVEPGVPAVQEELEKSKTGSGRADDQAEEESKPCVEETKSDQEKSEEVVTVVTVETEQPETGEPADQHTDESQKDEERLEEIETVQQQASSELASEISVETRETGTVEVTAPEDQQAPEEPKTDEEGLEDQGRADGVTDEQPTEQQSSMEDTESGQMSALEDLPEVASEVTAKAGQTDVGTVDSSDMSVEEAKKDETFIEQVEGGEQPSEELPQESAEVSGKKEEPDAAASEELPQESAEVSEKKEEPNAAASKELPQESADEIKTADVHVEKVVSDISTSEELPQESAEVPEKKEEPDTDEIKTADVHVEKVVSDISTQDQEVTEEQTKPADSDNVITAPYQDASEEPVSEEQEHETGEATRVVEVEDQKTDAEKQEPDDSGTEEHVSSSVAVVEHSKPPDDITSSQEQAAEQQQKASETEDADTTPTEDIKDVQTTVADGETPDAAEPGAIYTGTIDTTPPDDFEWKSVSETKLTVSSVTEVHVSTRSKAFTDIGTFHDLDSHAAEVSELPHDSYRHLAWHLMYARHLDSDLNKARAVFVYLCSKDLSKLSVDNVQPGSPQELLVSLSRRETTYARVFETLCLKMGLHCEVVSGFAKGADYHPGMKFSDDGSSEGQHSWNVIFVDGVWRLVDCHWAARKRVGKQVSADIVRYELDEYYFMPDPSQFILTHYPHDCRYQLLEKTVSLDEFEQSVPVKSTFFKYSLELSSHSHAIVNVDQQATIVIKCPPPEETGMLAFTFTLTSDELGDTFDGVDLNQFAMQQTIGRQESHFTIRPPKPGVYQLVIYVKSRDDTDSPFSGICEYQLVCERSADGVQPYPPCAHTSWGPGDSAGRYPLRPLHGDVAVLEAPDDGVVDVRLESSPGLRFTARLKSVDYRDDQLSAYVLQRVVNNVAIFLVKMPGVGEYGLEIYANDPETDGQSLRHAYQFLIICHKLVGDPPVPYPALPPNYLGPQPGFQSLGLVTEVEDPYLVVDTGELSLSFVASKRVRLSAQLVNVASGEDCSQYVLQQAVSEQLVKFIVRLPKLGAYKLQIFGALFTAEAAESLPGIFNFLVDCTKIAADSVGSFPQQYAPWKDGCYLHAPLDRKLTQPTSKENLVDFKLVVPQAVGVAVVVGSEWVMLKKGGENIWQGEVDMVKAWGTSGRAAVCAAYEGSAETYNTLLEYTT